MVKGKVLDDLLTDQPVIVLDPNSADQNPKAWWNLYVDGSMNKQGTGPGIILETPDDTIIEKAIRFGFFAPNNETEFEALIQGL